MFKWFKSLFTKKHLIEEYDMFLVLENEKIHLGRYIGTLDDAMEECMMRQAYWVFQYGKAGQVFAGHYGVERVKQ